MKFSTILAIGAFIWTFCAVVWAYLSFIGAGDRAFLLAVGCGLMAWVFFGLADWFIKYEYHLDDI